MRMIASVSITGCRRDPQRLRDGDPLFLEGTEPLGGPSCWSLSRVLAETDSLIGRYQDEPGGLLLDQLAHFLVDHSIAST